MTTFVQDVVWHSAVSDLDCTLLRLANCPPAPGLRIQKRRVRRTVPAPRMYIIGYPNGRGLEFSLDDNFLLDLGDKYLHYRTPTEGGSSGSPLFDENWMVVGIHRAGEDNSVKASGDTEANEGIALSAVLETLAQKG
jgi:V8-like Glu-specific endopeptidase